MLHASVTTPDLQFMLEERQLDVVGYKAVTTANPWDDLQYNVNFDYRFAGDTESSRLLTVPFKVNVDTPSNSV